MERSVLSIVVLFIFHMFCSLLILSRFGLSYQRILTFQAHLLQAEFSCIKDRSNHTIILS
jgi:hypothetical protein